MTQVSIVIPTWNRYELLLEALESVAAQTFTDYEVLLVDDGSDDRTSELNDPEVVRKLFGWNAGQFRFFPVPHCGFPGAVRNVGIRNAIGHWIAFLDSDDRWMPEKLALQVQRLEEGSERIIHTREVWNRNGRIVSQSKFRHRREGYLFEDALWKCTIGPSTVVLDASLFHEYGLFRGDVEVGEDYELWLRMTAREAVAYIDLSLVEKRAGDWDQLSERYGHIEYFRIEALRGLILQNHWNEIQRRQARSVLARKCRIYADGCLKRGKKEEADRFRRIAAEEGIEADE